MGSTFFSDSVRDDYHEYFDTTTWIPIFSFTAIVFLMLIFVIIYSCCKFKTVKMNNSKLKAYSLLSLLCFLTASIFFVLYALNAKFPFGTLNKLTLSFWAIYNSLWSMGYLFTYLLLYERQKTIFNQTMYCMSRRQSVTFFVLLVAYFVGQQIQSATWLLLNLSDSLSWNDFIVPWYVGSGTKLAIDLILNIFLVHMFCSNILKLTILSPRSSVQHNQSSTDITIFQMMIKYFVLSCFTIASTVIFTTAELILSVAIEVAADTGNYTFYRWWYCVYFVLCNVDCIVSSLFVLLSFSFASRWYYKCCRCLDTKCESWWKRATQPAQRRHVHQMTLVLSNTMGTVQNSENGLETTSENNIADDEHVSEHVTPQTPLVSATQHVSPGNVICLNDVLKDADSTTMPSDMSHIVAQITISNLSAEGGENLTPSTAFARFQSESVAL